MLAMSDKTRERLDNFWELIDEILNAILFLLIGVEILILTFTKQFMIAGLLAILTVLLARWVCIGVPIQIMKRFRTFSPYATTILTWGGLRGGISVCACLIDSGWSRMRTTFGDYLFRGGIFYSCSRPYDQESLSYYPKIVNPRK